MSLTRGAQEYIHASISYLFDFPSDPIELKKQIQKITRVFTDENAEQKEEDYRQLQRFIHQSGHFYHLEAQNKNSDNKAIPFTYGQVQVCILDYIDSLLKKITSGVGVDLISIGWDKDKILQNLINRPVYQQFFTSLQPAVENHEPHPYMEEVFPIAEFPSMEEETNERTTISLARHCSPQAKSILNNSFYVNLALKKETYLNYLLQIKADQLSTLNAIVTMQLLAHNIINLKQTESISFYTQRILSEEFYFKLILNDRRKFHQLKNLSEYSYDVLQRPISMKLIKTYNVPLAQVKSLSSYSLDMLEQDPLFLELIRLNVLAPKEFDDLFFVLDESTDSKQAIDNLQNIQPEKLEAIVDDFIFLASYGLLYHADLVTILSNPHLYCKNKKSIRHSLIIIKNKTIIQFVKRNLEDRLIKIVDKQPRVTNSHEIDSITTLIETCRMFRISFSDIVESTLKTVINCFLINKNRILLQRFIRCCHRFEMDKSTIWGTVLGMRLMAIYDDNPYIMSGSPDTMEKIKISLSAIAHLEKVAYGDIYYASIKYFFMEVRKDLLLTLDTVIPSSLSMYIAIVEEINLALEIENIAAVSSPIMTHRNWQHALFKIKKIISSDQTKEEEDKAMMNYPTFFKNKTRADWLVKIIEASPQLSPSGPRLS